MLYLLLFVGWMLGVIGFFTAISAEQELKKLRLLLAQSGAYRDWQPEVAVAASIQSTVISACPPPPPEPPRQEWGGPQMVEPPPHERFIAPPPTEPPAPASIDLEALLTLRWGVWLGAASLALAGVFLVRYAVEHALLGPAARCVLGALLGGALLSAAEWLRRQERPQGVGVFRNDQAPGGLAAGGVAVLFGAAYAAGPFYGLVGPSPGFVAMAAASFVGLGASLRFGQLTAAVGLIGGFATPALVATTAPSVPGLFAYLFAVSVASLFVVRRTAWAWLGWGTTIAGAFWVCFAALSNAPDIWAAAAFVPATALLNLALLPPAALRHPVGRQLSWVPFATLGAVGLFLECQVPGTAPRLALFMLSPIAIWKGATEPQLDRLPWLAALLGVLTLLLWDVPTWHASPEFSGINGLIEILLPGAWAPEVVRQLLLDASLLAALHASAGVWFERHATNPIRWAALVAVVPVVTLAVTYAQIESFQADAAWALAAAFLACGLTAAAASARPQSRPRAGVHAAGAAASLALGCAMVLHDQWLTLALSLFLPALAWIEAAANLPALRRVALAAAVLLLVRLLPNWNVLDYYLGTTILANGLVAAYAVPAAAFLVAAQVFRRRADDTLVATLQAGGISLASCFVALEIRHIFGHGQLTGPLSFEEAAWQLLTLAAEAVVLLNLTKRFDSIVLEWAWRVIGTIAFGCGILLMVFDPAVTGEQADVVSLAAAYLAPGLLAVVAHRVVPTAKLRDWLRQYSVAAGLVWTMLQIRFLFHPEGMQLTGLLGFDEAAWQVLMLAFEAVVLLYLAKRFDSAVLSLAWRVIGAAALGGGILLLLLNPALTNEPVGAVLLAVGYLVPGLVAVLARRWVPSVPLRDILTDYSVAAGLGWTTLQIRLLFHPHAMGLTGLLGFDEAAWDVLALAAEAVVLLHMANRFHSLALGLAWRVVGGVSLGSGALLLVCNPAFTNASVDVGLLAVAYLGPGVFAVVARRVVPTIQMREWLTGYSVAAGLVWITLQIRFLFHPNGMGLNGSVVDDAEMWAWSGAWLACGIGLLTLGIRARDTQLRQIALGVIGIDCGKVFLVDMADLAGLWRVFSFLGLGLALIGLGAVYRRFVLPTKDRPDGSSSSR